MPLEVVFEIGFRLAVLVIEGVGAGDTRTAAWTRLFTYALIGALSSLGLWWALLAASAPDASEWPYFAVLITAILGGATVCGVVSEFLRLRHWGEPVLTADELGLTLVRRKRTVAWDDIASVAPERRGAVGRVRIRFHRTAKDLFVATRRPTALAAAIMAEKGKRAPAMLDPYVNVN